MCHHEFEFPNHLPAHLFNALGILPLINNNSSFLMMQMCKQYKHVAFEPNESFQGQQVNIHQPSYLYVFVCVHMVNFPLLLLIISTLPHCLALITANYKLMFTGNFASTFQRNGKSIISCHDLEIACCVNRRVYKFVCLCLLRYSRMKEFFY